MYKILSTPINNIEFLNIIKNNDFSELTKNPLTGDFGREYYPATFDEKRVDTTFTIFFDEKPLIILLCTIGEDRFDWFNMPAQYFIRTGCEPNTLKKAFSLLLENINEIYENNNLSYAAIREEPINTEVTLFGNLAMSNKWYPVVGINGAHDHLLGEDYFFRNLRKRYKGYINWGRKNLTLNYFNIKNKDVSIFNEYRKLHAQVSGRVTRCNESWNKMSEHILSGKGELSLGINNKGDIMTGTLVVDGSERSYYASGAYKHTEENEPLAHYPTYDAIIRSSARGMKTFDFGEIHQNDKSDKKNVNIGYFKKGFCTKLSTFIEWRLDRCTLRQNYY